MGKVADKVASYITKEAKISFSKLKAFTGGVKPLFHMTDASNAKSLLKTKKILSPGELSARGINTTVEGSMGHDRFGISGAISAPIKAPVGAPATMDFKDYGKTLFSDDPIQDMSKRFFAREIAALKTPGATSMYNMTSIANRMRNSGAKNWSTVSLSHGKPLKSYGEIGMMVSPKASKYPINSDKHQAFVAPKPIIQKGVPTGMELPSVEGKLLYNPQSVDRATAKQFKESGGVALNSRFYRKLKAINKKLPEAKLIDAETGNRGISMLEYRNKPAYDKYWDETVPAVRKHLGDVVREYS